MNLLNRLLLSSLLAISPLAMAEVPNWQVQSKGTATWLFMDIYNAELATQAPLQKDFLANTQALQLELCYLKPIGKDILIKGANEILPERLTPEFQQAVNQLHDSYQDVTPQDCYQLVYEQGETQLRFNQKTVFKTDLVGFKKLYFGIWLGDNPLSDRLKKSLLDIK